jgi:AraC-like DNA-binding protein
LIPPRGGSNPFDLHLAPVCADREEDADWHAFVPWPNKEGPSRRGADYQAFTLPMARLRLVALRGPACRKRLEQGDLLSVGFVADGDVRIRHSDASWRLGAGDCLITSDSAIDWISSPFSVVFLLFSRHQLHEVTRSVKLRIDGPTVIAPATLQEPLIVRAGAGSETDSLLRALQLVLSMVSDLQSSAPFLLSCLGLDGQLCTLIALLAYPDLRQTVEEGCGAPLGIDRAIDQVVAFIDAHLADPLSLAEIESNNYYSRRSIQYAFRRRFGCTVTQWIRARRLDLAYRRFSLGVVADSVGSVARACGYRSMSLFSIEFQQRFHVKPSDLLREAKAFRCLPDPDPAPGSWVRQHGDPEL